jgi:mono/diheme cytochrome c family protein
MSIRTFAMAAVLFVAEPGWAGEASMGREVYQRACAHCHGAEGEGWKEKNGPTLRQTEWVTGDPDRLIRITLDGLYLRIPLKNGTHYGCMPGLRRELTDQEMAEVLSYVRAAWGNSAGAVSAERVAVLRAATPAREWPWRAADFGLEAKAKLGAGGEALEPADAFAAAGFRVYGALCQSCHQPDGRGLVTEDGHGFPPPPRFGLRERFLQAFDPDCTRGVARRDRGQGPSFQRGDAAVACRVERRAGGPGVDVRPAGLGPFGSGDTT